MTVLRRIVCACLLLTLPLQFAAAWAACCPPATATSPAHAAPATPQHVHHADGSVAHAAQPCDDGALGSGAVDHDEHCKGGRCASHCAHAQPSLAASRSAYGLALAEDAPAATGPVARQDAPAPSFLRPPIAALR